MECQSNEAQAMGIKYLSGNKAEGLYVSTDQWPESEISSGQERHLWVERRKCVMARQTRTAEIRLV